ncbi:putative deoxyribonuclease YcfH [bacterium BMS3Abin10]|nr:putative deoxyribonuclease YcfH [bacterium BMS3Abin10]GBE38475.1 putative deoxyribonuclease YcfH [bacterium BMS3Bbin08]
MQPRLIDTHCHLEMTAFDSDRNTVISRATDVGVEYMITIGSDREGNIKGLRISSDYPNVYLSVGIHPHDAKTLDQELFSELQSWAKQPKTVAIGEIGLDYHYMHSPKEVQISAFKKQLALAKDTGLPVVVHSREAKKDTLQILREEAAGISGVLHCFSGDMDMAKQAMDMGFYISIAGPVTFKNANKLREVVSFIPDERLLIETDAPYLSPVPMRGKRNEPSFLKYTAQVIAESRGVTVTDISRITTLNAMSLFKIGDIPREGRISYKIRDSLYLNITNRCTNKCGFCVRFHTSFVKGHNLRLEQEPSAAEVIMSIGDLTAYKEIVFCGIGEPLMRLDVVKEVSAWVKQKGGKVRINTNGHGNLINKRNILPELDGLVDSISISLDADDEKKYEAVCKPSFKNAFQAVISFIKEAKKHIPEVQITVVAVPEIDVEKCKDLAKELGVELRVREFNVVG